MNRTLTALALLLLALAAPAQVTGPGQDVSVTGVVVPLPGPIGCGPATHMLMCTQVFLYGDTALLQSLVGKNVRLLGTEASVSGASCHLVKVAGAEAPPVSLDWCGSPTPGCALRFVVCPGAIAQFWLFASPAEGYHPLAPIKGTWLLGDPAFLLATGVGGGPCHDFDVTVPPDPVLIGVTVHLQAARRDIGPAGPIQLTNSICITILPSTMPCVPPNC
jgi:hypothetical protein